MREVLFGSVLLASFLGGVVALLAPCCVSVMLPAYLATAFRRRSRLLAATLVFAAGVGTVILPIGLGASALAAAFQGYHLWIFGIGGVLMAAGGVAVLAGWKPVLPMPAGRAAAGGGMGSVYGLGLFSGIASACCAPVLIGVTVLAGATASFGAALAVGVTYVLGMVAPLLVISLVWERTGGRSGRWLQGRQVMLRLGRWRRRASLGTAASGALLVGMGLLTVVLGLSGPAMPSGRWQFRFAADLQHAAALVTDRLGWLPGWVLGGVLLAEVAWLVATAIRRRTGGAHDAVDQADRPDDLSLDELAAAAGRDRDPTEEAPDGV